MSSRLVKALVAVILLLAIGTTIYHQIEGWSWVDSFYFTGVSLLTIGYGDLTPTHDLSKILTVIFGFAAISVGLYALTAVAEEIERRFHRIQMTLPFTHPAPTPAEEPESKVRKIAEAN